MKVMYQELKINKIDKELMKLTKMYVLLCLPLFTSCVISPWKTITYNNLELSNLQNIDPRDYYSMPDKEGYKKYYVNDAFIFFFAQSLNETVYDSEGPYRFGIRVTGSNNKNLSFTIYNLIIRSESGKDYTYQLQENFPVTISIPNAEQVYYSQDAITQQYFYTAKSFVTSTYFNFQEERNVKIYVEIDIEVNSDESKERKKIDCYLNPVKKRGLFKPLVW